MKTLSIGGRQDGWARFSDLKSERPSCPAGLSVDAKHCINRLGLCQSVINLPYWKDKKTELNYSPRQHGRLSGKTNPPISISSSSISSPLMQRVFVYITAGIFAGEKENHWPHRAHACRDTDKKRGWRILIQPLLCLKLSHRWGCDPPPSRLIQNEWSVYFLHISSTSTALTGETIVSVSIIGADTVVHSAFPALPYIKAQSCLASHTCFLSLGENWINTSLWMPT